MLTKRRAAPDMAVLAEKALEFIRGYLIDHGGVSPTFREINTAIDARSLSVVSRVMDRLEAAGKLRRTRSRAHAIEILDKGTPRPRCPDLIIPKPGKVPAALGRVYLLGIRLT